MAKANVPQAKYDVDVGALGARLGVARDESESDVAVVEHVLPAGALGSPVHRHGREDEISYVLEGEVTVLQGEEVSTAGPGEFVVKPRNVWHAFWNAGDEPLRFLEIIAPGGFASFFEEVADLYPLDPEDEDAVARTGEIFERYGFEARLESVPELCERYGLRPA
jgi:mannose-6-phosphate isomerase-like protein (cupin superfamily)